MCDSREGGSGFRKKPEECNSSVRAKDDGQVDHDVLEDWDLVALQGSFPNCIAQLSAKESSDIWEYRSEGCRTPPIYTSPEEGTLVKMVSRHASPIEYSCFLPTHLLDLHPSSTDSGSDAASLSIARPAGWSASVIPFGLLLIITSLIVRPTYSGIVAAIPGGPNSVLYQYEIYVDASLSFGAYPR